MLLKQSLEPKEVQLYGCEVDALSPRMDIVVKLGSRSPGGTDMVLKSGSSSQGGTDIMQLRV